MFKDILKYFPELSNENLSKIEFDIPSDANISQIDTIISKFDSERKEFLKNLLEKISYENEENKKMNLFLLKKMKNIIYRIELDMSSNELKSTQKKEQAKNFITCLKDRLSGKRNALIVNVNRDLIDKVSDVFEVLLSFLPGKYLIQKVSLASKFFNYYVKKTTMSLHLKEYDLNIQDIEKKVEKYNVIKLTVETKSKTNAANLNKILQNLKKQLLILQFMLDVRDNNADELDLIISTIKECKKLTGLGYANFEVFDLSEFENLKDGSFHIRKNSDIDFIMTWCANKKDIIETCIVYYETHIIDDALIEKYQEMLFKIQKLEIKTMKTLGFSAFDPMTIVDTIKRRNYREFLEYASSKKNLILNASGFTEFGGVEYLIYERYGGSSEITIWLFTNYLAFENESTFQSQCFDYATIKNEHYATIKNQRFATSIIKDEVHHKLSLKLIIELKKLEILWIKHVDEKDFCVIFELIRKKNCYFKKLFINVNFDISLSETSIKAIKKFIQVDNPFITEVEISSEDDDLKIVKSKKSSHDFEKAFLYPIAKNKNLKKLKVPDKEMQTVIDDCFMRKIFNSEEASKFINEEIIEIL